MSAQLHRFHFSSAADGTRLDRAPSPQPAPTRARALPSPSRCQVVRLHGDGLGPKLGVGAAVGLQLRRHGLVYRLLGLPRVELGLGEVGAGRAEGYVDPGYVSGPVDLDVQHPGHQDVVVSPSPVRHPVQAGLLADGIGLLHGRALRPWVLLAGVRLRNLVCVAGVGGRFRHLHRVSHGGGPVAACPLQAPRWVGEDQAAARAVVYQHPVSHAYPLKGIRENGSAHAVNDLGTAAGCRRIGLTSTALPTWHVVCPAVGPMFPRQDVRCRRLDALRFRSGSAGERRITDEALAFGRMGA